MKGTGGFDHCLALQWVDWFAWALAGIQDPRMDDDTMYVIVVFRC
jgi:hypothetical protein